MAQTIVGNDDLEYGDVVLNFGGSADEGKSTEQLARDHVLRLMAYLLFANRIGMPTRHLIQSDALFTLANWMPELLVEGLLIPDTPAGIESITENTRNAEYRESEDAQSRAAFLDEKSRFIREFDATGMMSQFRLQMLKDLKRGGALSILLNAELDSGEAVTDALSQRVSELEPMRHDAFLSALKAQAPLEAHDLLGEWAAVRYYTIPMDFDICIRDLPHQAVKLMIRAEALQPTFIEDPDDHGSVPEPMRSAMEVLSLEFPEVYGEADARALVEAVLRTREDVPEARSKFAAVVHVAFEDELVAEINGRLRENLLRERLLRTNSPTLSAGFKHAVKESGWASLIDLAAGPLAPVIGGLRAAALEQSEHARMKIEAPWKVSCEYLHHAHNKSRLRTMLSLADPDTPSLT